MRATSGAGRLVLVFATTFALSLPADRVEAGPPEPRVVVASEAPQRTEGAVPRQSRDLSEPRPHAAEARRVDRRPQSALAGEPQDVEPPRLGSAPPPPPPPALAGSESGTEGEDIAPDSAADFDHERARRWLAGGGTLVAAGGVLVVGAIALAISDPCARPAGNGCQQDARNRGAATMAIPGVLAVAAGAVLIGLVLRDKRRALHSRSKSGVAWSELGLSWRF